MCAQLRGRLRSRLFDLFDKFPTSLVKFYVFLIKKTTFVLVTELNISRVLELNSEGDFYLICLESSRRNGLILCPLL